MENRPDGAELDELRHAVLLLLGPGHHRGVGGVHQCNYPQIKLHLPIPPWWVFISATSALPRVAWDIATHVFGMLVEGRLTGIDRKGVNQTQQERNIQKVPKMYEVNQSNGPKMYEANQSNGKNKKAGLPKLKR